MELFPGTLAGNLKRAIKSGAVKREDDLEQVTDRLPEIFQCDSLSLVEVAMIVEERGQLPKTVGELLDLIDGAEPDDSVSRTRKK